MWIFTAMFIKARTSPNQIATTSAQNLGSECILPPSAQRRAGRMRALARTRKGEAPQKDGLPETSLRQAAASPQNPP